jgi:hypothetical protein
MFRVRADAMVQEGHGRDNPAGEATERSVGRNLRKKIGLRRALRAAV